MFDNFTKISFIFLISVGDRTILMFLPVFFFLFKALLTPCETNVLVVATPEAGIIFLAKSLAYGKIALKISPKLPPCCK